MARDILTRLKLPVKLIDTVAEIIKKHMILYRDVTDKKFNKLLSEMAMIIYGDWLSIAMQIIALKIMKLLAQKMIYMRD